MAHKIGKMSRETSINPIPPPCDIDDMSLNLPCHVVFEFPLNIPERLSNQTNQF